MAEFPLQEEMSDEYLDFVIEQHLEYISDGD